MRQEQDAVMAAVRLMVDELIGRISIGGLPSPQRTEAARLSVADLPRMAMSYPARQRWN